MNLKVLSFRASEVGATAVTPVGGKKLHSQRFALSLVAVNTISSPTAGLLLLAVKSSSVGELGAATVKDLVTVLSVPSQPITLSVAV